MFARIRRVVPSGSRCLVAGMALVSAAAGIVLPAGVAEASESALPPDIGWLAAVNGFRIASGLAPVAEDAGLSAASYQHSCYMLLNGVAHDEVPGLPGYTPEGDLAGNNGNVAGTGSVDETDLRFVELWMTAPFHAIGMLRPNLTSVGYGKCTNPATAFKSAATLDVVRGLKGASAQVSPILFPGNGAATTLDRFVAETPDPRTFCGWTGTAGLPVMAMMPEAVTGPVSATMTGPAGPVEMCALSQHNTTGVAQSLMKGNNVVIGVPRTILPQGAYAVTMTTPARTVTWTFTVGSTAVAATPSPTPAPAATPATTPAITPATTPPATRAAAAAAANASSVPSGFQPLTPGRVVDTRDGTGAVRLQANGITRIQITGAGGVPAGAGAVSANFTITNPAGSGFLTTWNCAPERPVVATLNFAAGDTTPNAASVPLDASGALCVYSPVATDLVLDVNGYYSGAGTSRFTAVAPTRLMDTRIALGSAGRLAANGTIALRVGGTAGIPASARAAILNVTSVDPARAGYVTVYPCDQPRPLAASLNPQPGAIRPNLVVAPLAADGSVCLFTSSEVDLVIDVTGHLSTTSALGFTSTPPFRFTDTRDVTRADVNAGTGGNEVAAGSITVIKMSGVRGVPANATAVSVNIAVTGADRDGFLTAFPCGEVPGTASVNYRAEAAISNGAQLPLSASGELCVYSTSGAHVVVDLNGWWS